MPRGPLGDRVDAENTLWECFRTTWIDAAGATHLAIYQRPHPMFENDEFLQMLVDEGRILARLDHPAVVRLFDSGIEDGHPYLVLQWIEGTMLDKTLDRAAARDVALPLPLAVWIASCVARALEHGQTVSAADGSPLGVIHRDVRPGLVHLGWDGSVRLGGYGIALFQHTRESAPRAGVIIGTLSNLSPEQARGERLDGKSDVFACGVLLYRLVTGIHPFEGATQLETLERIVLGEPPSVRDRVPSLPSAVANVIERALSRKPAGRPAAAEMAAQLEAWNAAQPEPGSPRALARFLKELFDPESLER